MTTLLIITHVLVSFFLIAIVLLQHGKGADIGATFGGSGQSVFGSEGPVPLLNKITTFSAIVFMGTSISLAYISANEHSDSIMKNLPAQETTAPAQKEAPVTIPMPETESQVQLPAPEAEASPAVQEALSEEATASPAVQESEAAEVELPAIEEEPVAEAQNIEVVPAAEEQVAPVEQETETAPEQAE
ncbi:MAG: preprotein translocase subunit SecG [Candidatus Electrothrix communis]|nr:preprotein translocase subunit SecG [Desulfobulbus sp. US4]WLE96776.1 MAG: preprotein translocase subunit SecG [Candidatus Electrothrix communis]